MRINSFVQNCLSIILKGYDALKNQLPPTLAGGKRMEY